MITGVAPVQVDLPIFVTQASLFDRRDAYDKKTLERFWKDQRYMGFASDKATKPSAGDLPDWVFARLRTPQSLFSLDGSRLFPPNDPLLRVLPIAWERFQTAQAEVSGDDISEEISVFDLGKWASAQSDDETLAWIIFLAAQRPGRESASALFEELESLPGPASESAVQYFIACAQACAEALEQRKEPGRTFRRIVKRLPRNDDATSEQISVEQNDGGMPSMAMSPVAMAVQSLGPVTARKRAPLGGEKAPDIPPGSGGPSILNASAPKQGGVEEMAAKAEIIRLLESVSVGANSFAEGVAAIEAQLAVLKHLHEDALLASERARAADEEAELARRAEQEAIEQRAIWWASTSRRASELISRVQSSIPDLHDLRIAVVDSTTQDASEIDASLDSVDAVVEAAIQAEIAAESAATTEAPAGLKPRERSQFRLEAAQKASAALNASIAELETNLRRCPVLIVGDGTPSDHSPRPIEVDVQCATDTVAEPDSPADIVESSSSRADAIAADLSGLIGANAGVGEHTATATARAPKSLDNEPEADGNRPTSSPDALAESEPLTQHPDPTHANTVASQTVKTVGTAEPPEVRSEQSEVAQQDQPPKEAPNSGESDSEIVDEAWLDDQFGPLQRFLDSRRYALGQVQVDALLQIVRSDSPFASDAVLLKGGFAATASLDSRASVDFRLSDDMEGYLTNGSVPTTHASEALSPYLGVLAATLGCALFESPGDGVRWMVLSFLKAGVTGHPPLEALVKHLEGMNHSGLILTRELVAASKVGAQAAATAEVRRLRERAASWKSDDEIFNNWTAPDYREIHDAMFSDKFSIGKCVALVAKGDDKGVAEAFGDAKRRIEKGSGTLADLCKRVGRRRPVEGVGRDHMMDNMNATKAFVTRYFEAVERVKKPSGDLPSNLVAFLTELYRELASAISYVREFPPADSLVQCA